MNGPAQHLAEKLRILQLETLYDLAMTLRAQRPEEEQVDELLQRVCAVLDPAAAVAVTRNAVGAPRASASVGWARAPEGEAILAEPLGERLLMAGKPVVLEDGTLLGRDYRQLLAVPLSHRELQMGFLAVVDKEVRAGDSSGAGAGRFSGEDRRFLDSVAALAGVSLAGARRLERAEAQRQRLAEENKVL